MRLLTKFHLIEKREGKIMDQCIDKSTGELLTGNRMNHELIKHYEISHKQDGYEEKDIEFPDLPEKLETEIELIQIAISNGKALSWDCL
jgi:hypothetical protein